MKLFRVYRPLTLAALILFAQALSAQNAVDQLYSSRKYELADAYYKAGQRFVELEQKERGEEFMARAQAIYPGYKPGNPPVSKPQTTPEPVATVLPVTDPTLVPERPQVVERNLNAEKIARLQFSKLLRGYLTMDTDTIKATIWDTLTVGELKPLPKADVVDQASAYFRDNPTPVATPDDYFDMTSIAFAAAPKFGPGAISMTVKARMDAPGNLKQTFGFWKATQTYTFVKDGSLWKLAAIQGK